MSSGQNIRNAFGIYVTFKRELSIQTQCSYTNTSIMSLQIKTDVDRSNYGRFCCFPDSELNLTEKNIDRWVSNLVLWKMVFF